MKISNKILLKIEMAFIVTNSLEENVNEDISLKVGVKSYIWGDLT